MRATCSRCERRSKGSSPASPPNVAPTRSSGSCAGCSSVGNAAVAAGRIDDLPALNTEFHTTLAAAADNELLASTLARLSDIIRWVYAARIQRRSQRSWCEHAGIVEAVAAGDGARAERCGFDHIVAAAAAYED
ncbi:MAG: FCD domain-containing protein [Ilumatobacteraceae bacterium]